MALEANRFAYHANADGYTRPVVESLVDGSTLPIDGLPPGVCEFSAFGVDGLQAAITRQQPT